MMQNSTALSYAKKISEYCSQKTCETCIFNENRRADKYKGKNDKVSCKLNKQPCDWNI